jgi:ribonucleoside-diphosphate reductase alpha chain
LRNNTGSDERRTHNLNLALWVPDVFMKRVEQDGKWSLFSPNDVPELLSSFGEDFERKYEQAEVDGKAIRSLPARTLYAKMLQVLAETGNGWICFKDKANLRSAQTGYPGNMIHSSNLCTEILEVTSGPETAVCNLGSVNLSSFVTPSLKFDFERLKSVVETAMTFLDRVVDINFYPTSEARESNHKWRPVGLGIMGLQDVFFKLRLPFNSPEAQKLSAQISETINESRYLDGKLQVQLAAENQEMMPELQYDWKQMAEQVRKNGLRNSLLIAIAPTATIASIVGSFESIEPQVSNFFKRETLSGEFLQVNRYLIADLKKLGLWTPVMRSKIIESDGSIQNIEQIPLEVRELYKTVWDLPQKDLIVMAAARSAFICQSQSLNLFMESPNVGKLSSMYMYAWKQGVKTTYYLRSRAKTTIQKTTLYQEPEAAVSCSLENPESCESCQ